MMKSSILILFLSLYLTSSLAQEPKQGCVLNFDGTTTCDDTAVTVRMGGRAPCARTDVNCWCEKAREYTNEVRKKNGVSKMLKTGTQKQMDNAMSYAKKLGKMGFLKHQDLSKVTKEVGCQRWMGGENLAFNYETGDIAKMCVQQWVNSKGHFENLVRDWFEEVVVGFHFERDGRVYCVQTFALPFSRGTVGSPTDRGCQTVQTGPSRPSPRPSPPRRTAPKNSPPSCACIKAGRTCRTSVARSAGNGCRAGLQRFRQSRRCKLSCCNFCKGNSRVGDCGNWHVKRICGNL